MTEKLKAMTDEEIVTLINKIVTFNEDLELKDLKAILAEISGRKMEKKYINVIAEKIKSKLQPEPVEERRKKEVLPVKEEKKVKTTFDDVYSAEDEEDEEKEKYPVLSFLVGLYKVFAFILLIGIIAIAGLVSLLIFKEKMLIVCSIMFGSVILGIFLFIAFYAMSEKIKLNMDIEKHLRNLLEK